MIGDPADTKVDYSKLTARPIDCPRCGHQIPKRYYKDVKLCDECYFQIREQKALRSKQNLDCYYSAVKPSYYYPRALSQDREDEYKKYKAAKTQPCRNKLKEVFGISDRYMGVKLTQCYPCDNCTNVMGREFAGNELVIQDKNMCDSCMLVFEWEADCYAKLTYIEMVEK